MAGLYGWASFMMPFVDHAYVTSSEGHRWGCFGGTQGGREICRGSGDAGAAHCISHPDAEAGIDYGVTGVCHQAANRILWPAGVVVSGAGGYALSSMIYGAYGTPTETAQQEWQDVIKRCAADQVSEQPPGVQDALRRLTKKEREYTAALIALHTQAGRRGAADLPAQETALLIRYRLPEADGGLIEAVQGMREKLLAQKRTLDAGLQGKRFDGARYAAEVNDLINKSLEECARVIGKEPFQRLFGLVPGERCEVVVPEIAAAVHK